MKKNESLKKRMEILLGANPNRNRNSRKSTKEGVVKKICYFIIHILTNILTFIVNIFTKKNTPKHLEKSNRQRRKLSVERAREEERRNPFTWCS